jgi:predicted  nucleic acid-binding Zn-ribbon protein
MTDESTAEQLINMQDQPKPQDVTKLMERMFELQTLEFEETIEPNTEKRIASLRAKIPAPVLAHYDRLCARGKKGVAVVHHQTCTGCHMRVPLGVVLELQHGEDVRCCDNCGRYLYLREEPVEVSLPAPEKPAVKAGRKQLAHAR